MSKIIRTPTIHEKEMVVDKEEIKEILDNRKLEYIEFYEKVVRKYGLDLSYKSFMNLLSNRSTWKLLYAHAISDVLNVPYTQLFKVIDVDKEKALQEKAEWNEKYGNNKNKG